MDLRATGSKEHFGGNERKCRYRPGIKKYNKTQMCTPQKRLFSVIPVIFIF